MKRFRITFIDFIIIIGLIIALAVGFCTVKHFRQTADKQIEATVPINFQVYVRGITVTDTKFPIAIGEKSFITIRNVPYTELDVINVKAEPRKILTNYSNGKIYAVEDPAQKFMYDATITIADTAKITKDGAVVGGNKIKIGLPIVLEGQTYKFGGTISNIKILSDKD